MELSEFVSKTITEVFKGIKDAQENVKELGGAVNPLGRYDTEFYVGNIRSISTDFPSDSINFEILITETGEEKHGGGIGVLFPSIKACANIENKSGITNVNKISFSLAVHFPVMACD